MALRIDSTATARHIGSNVALVASVSASERTIVQRCESSYAAELEAYEQSCETREFRTIAALMRSNRNRSF